MIDKAAIQGWIEDVPADHGVAIDDGGLRLVEIDSNGKATGNSLEVGGIPEPEEPENANNALIDWAHQITAVVQELACESGREVSAETLARAMRWLNDAAKIRRQS